MYVLRQVDTVAFSIQGGPKTIRSRLSRVVQAGNKAAAECPACGGTAGSVLRVTIDDEPMRPVEACARCGRTPSVVRLIVESDREAAPAAA